MHVLRFFLTLTSVPDLRCAQARRRIPALIHRQRPPHLPPTLWQLFAAALILLISLSRTHSQTSCDPNCRSNPIAHRVRRKHQRLPPSLLIENASDQQLSNPKCLPRGVSDQG